MQTFLHELFRDTPDGREADRILRSCVHCGFCNATCPTYQELGDELDGDTGRSADLAALAGTQLDVVHRGPDRDDASARRARRFDLGRGLGRDL